MVTLSCFIWKMSYIWKLISFFDTFVGCVSCSRIFMAVMKWNFVDAS